MSKSFVPVHGRILLRINFVALHGIRFVPMDGCAPCRRL
jgi:hypothetical protein